MPCVWKNMTKAWKLCVSGKRSRAKKIHDHHSFSCTCPSGTLKTGKFITGTGFSSHFYSRLGRQESKCVDS